MSHCHVATYQGKYQHNVPQVHQWDHRNYFVSTVYGLPYQQGRQSGVGVCAFTCQSEGHWFDFALGQNFFQTNQHKGLTQPQRTGTRDFPWENRQRGYVLASLPLTLQQPRHMKALRHANAMRQICFVYFTKKLIKSTLKFCSHINNNKININMEYLYRFLYKTATYLQIPHKIN